MSNFNVINFLEFDGSAWFNELNWSLHVLAHSWGDMQLVMYDLCVDGSYTFVFKPVHFTKIPALVKLISVALVWLVFWELT